MTTHNNIVTATPQIAPAQHLDLPIGQITADPKQARRHFDSAALAELAETIRAHGVIQPIVVRLMETGESIGDAEGFDAKQPGYRIVAGERRWRAARLAGLKNIPAVVRSGLSAAQLLALQLVENIQREDLKLREQIESVGRLVDMVGATQAARQVSGKDKAWASRLSNLRDAWRPVRDLIDDGLIESPDVACELVTLRDVNPAAAETFVGYFRSPPKHRSGPPTRDEIRDSISLHRNAATTKAKAKAERDAAEIATDNRKGYESHAGEPREPTAAAEERKAEARTLEKTAAESAQGEHLQADADDECADQLEHRLGQALGLIQVGTGDDPGWQFNGVPVDFVLEARRHGEHLTFRVEIDGLSQADVEALATTADVPERRAAPAPRSQAAYSASIARSSEHLGEFLATETRYSPDDHIKSDWLYERYRAWCGDHGHTPFPIQPFGASLAAAGIESKRRNHGVIYLHLTPVNP